MSPIHCSALIPFPDAYQKIDHPSHIPGDGAGLTYTVVSKIVPVDLLLKSTRLCYRSVSAEHRRRIHFVLWLPFTLSLCAVCWLTAKRYISEAASGAAGGFISFLKLGLYWLIGDVETWDLGSVRDQLPPGIVVIITALFAAGVRGLFTVGEIKVVLPSEALEMKAQWM